MAPTEPAKCWRTVIEGERAIVPRRFQQNAPPPAKDGPRINEEITSRTILLIGDDGHKYGEIGTDEGRALAEERFQAFIEQVGRRLAGGRSVTGELFVHEAETQA